MLTRRHLTEFIVLDMDLKSHEEPKRQSQQTPNPHKTRSSYKLASVEIARASDFGYNDNRTIALTHLGHILRPGDWCLGYDLRTINLSGVGDMQAFLGSHKVYFVFLHLLAYRRFLNYLSVEAAIVVVIVRAADVHLLHTTTICR